MRKVLLLLLFLLPLFAHADVLQGVVVDAVTGEPLPASVEVKQGGKNFTSSYKFSCDSTGFYDMNVYNDGRLVLTATMLGYYPARKMLYAYGRDSHDTIRVDTLRLRPTELMLNEVVVSAKMKRFTMSGDTIVFHPEAFKLEEGARLDELIRKLPGVQNRDGRLFFNGKPIRLVMNGHDIFGGSNMLGQLPAVAADKLKVYDMASDLERRSGNRDGEEDHVLDIRIKKSFLDKWYGYAEAGYVTQKHYAGEVSATRLSDNDPVLVFGNINDRNSKVEKGMNWGSWGAIDQFGKQLYGTALFQHNWHPDYLQSWERNEYDGGAGLAHYDGWGSTRVSSQTFFPDEAASYSLGRSDHASHQLAPNADFHLRTRTDSVNSFDVHATTRYERSDRRMQSVSAETDVSPFAYGDFPLDAAMDAAERDSLYRHIINRSRYYSTSKTDRFTATLNASWRRNLGARGDLTTEVMADYSHSVERSHDNRTLDYVREQRLEQLYQYGRTPSHGFKLSAGERFNYWLTKKVNLSADYKLQYNDQHNERNFYAAADEALLRGSLDAFRDAANSYSSKTRTWGSQLTLRGTLSLGKMKIMPALTWSYRHEQMDYRRGRLDTAATRGSHVVEPNIRYNWKIDRSQSLDLSFNYGTTLPDLLQTLAYRDDANPLYISEGNPALHRYHYHYTELNFRKLLIRQQLDYTLGLSYRKEINPISTVATYNASTGSYRSTYDNVRGGDTWNLHVYVYKDIGVLFHVKNDFNTSLTTRYGYLTATSEGSVQPLNRTRTYALRDEGEFGIENEWVEAAVYGDVSFSRYRYSQSAGFNSTPVDYSYGARAAFTWGQWRVSTDFSDHARTGYLSTDMNGHRVLWSADVRYKFLKNKASVSLRLNDILNQDKHYRSSYQAYERTEIWEDHMHHYAELSFRYTFDAKGK